MDFDVIVLGGGPGGYPAAIRSAQLGMKTACIERDRLGGICLNWGCIPTKALLKNAEIYHTMQVAPEEWGIGYDNLRVDFSKVIKRSRDVSDRVVKGIDFLFRKNKIEHIKGFGALTGKNSIEVTGPDGVMKTVTANKIVIATGARARMLPEIKPDGKQILSSTEAMIMDHIPESMTVIGAGAIGMEFAYFYKSFGTKVSVVEMMPNLLPIEDTEVSAEIEKLYKRQGYQLFTKHKVLSVKADKKGTHVEIESADGKKQTLDAECVLVAIGVQGNTENIGLEKLGIKMTKGFIDVDEYMRVAGAVPGAQLDGIYAVGDVAGPPWLAHVATHEGIIAAEHLAGQHPHALDYNNIPGCTYCQPQVASVGLTERARAMGETDGFVKLVIGTKYDEILGAHIIGFEAAEMIEEIVVGRAHGATGMSLTKTIHPHPTWSEAVMEAASVAEGEPIHL
jgi:dihydrolipoamide dehydrogenase